MKTAFKLFFAGVLMSAACAAACNEPNGQQQNEEGTEIKPVPVGEVSDEVAAFIDANLFRIVTAVGEQRGLVKGKDFCIMINRADELPKVDYQGVSIEYPAIDFDSYTLILGGLIVGDGSSYVENQRVFVESNQVTIYLAMGTKIGPSIPSFRTFGGLYPKIPNLPIKIVKK